ncbi:MAG: 50S ribosomal protein L18 [Planctomycetes bacterium]|nr:50S ribosomal protein L18 [Planctomycetota bacterium]
MVNSKSRKARQHVRKALSVRSRIRREAGRPRLSVFRSLKHIGAQVIDDQAGRTLAAASSLDKVLRDSLKGLKKSEVAARIGAAVAERALQAGVKQVAFDRGSFRYHGRVKALAEAARQGGLQF